MKYYIVLVDGCDYFIETMPVSCRNAETVAEFDNLVDARKRLDTLCKKQALEQAGFVFCDNGDVIWPSGYVSIRYRDYKQSKVVSMLHKLYFTLGVIMEASDQSTLNKCCQEIIQRSNK